MVTNISVEAALILQYVYLKQDKGLIIYVSTDLRRLSANKFKVELGVSSNGRSLQFKGPPKDIEERHDQARPDWGLFLHEEVLKSLVTGDEGLTIEYNVQTRTVYPTMPRLLTEEEIKVEPECD